MTEKKLGTLSTILLEPGKVSANVHGCKNGGQGVHNSPDAESLEGYQVTAGGAG